MRLLRFARNDRRRKTCKDKSRLAPGTLQYLPHAFQVHGLGLVAVAADDRRGHREGVEDGFLRGLDRGGEERIQMRVGEGREGEGALFGIVGNDVAGREGQDELATACADHMT